MSTTVTAAGSSGWTGASSAAGAVACAGCCGRTDTDYPNLEFRYCSKCNGYYCYCIDHINNHVHITTPPEKQ